MSNDNFKLSDFVTSAPEELKNHVNLVLNDYRKEINAVTSIDSIGEVREPSPEEAGILIMALNNVANKHLLALVENLCNPTGRTVEQRKADLEHGRLLTRKA